jgi:hypothetical protein
MKTKTVVIPKIQFIGSGAEELYRLEAKLHHALKMVALEWGKLNGLDEGELHSQLYAQAIFDQLGNYDDGVGHAVVQAWQTKGTS